jgi:hypothetical protein
MRALIPSLSRDVLEPYLDRRGLGDALEMSLQRAREILWNGPPLLPAS